MRCRTLACLPLAVFVLAGLGCMQMGTWTQEATIAGGEKYEIPLGSGGVPRTEDATARVDVAGMMLDSKSQLACFTGRLSFKKDISIKSILVRDITEDPVMNLIYVENPKIVNHVWTDTDAYKPLTEPEFKWLLLIDNSFRVYEFTIVTTDGQTLVYRQANLYNQYTKEVIRKGMGLKD